MLASVRNAVRLEIWSGSVRPSTRSLPHAAPLLDQRLFGVAKLLRQHHLGLGQQIASIMVAAFEHWHALSTQSENFALLCRFRNPKRDLAGRSRHEHFAAEQSGVDGYIDISAQIVTISLESRVGPDSHVEVDISSRAVFDPGATLSRHADLAA